MFENFFQSKKNAFGLDIGYKSLKAVELRQSGKNFSLVGYREIPIPENTVQKNSIVNKNEIIQALRDAVSSAKPHRITLRKVCSALPASLTFTKILKMPAMKPEELEKAIPYEVADFFPIPIIEMNLDWHVMNNSNAAGPKAEMEILVVGAPKTLVKDYMEITSKAGLELLALETKPISTARAVLADDRSESAVLVDIGAEVTGISLADQGLIEITTIVQTGGNAITRDLAKALDASPEEAENIKISQKLELIKSDSKNTSIIKNLTPIIDEIKGSIKYFETRMKKNTKITQIILSGGGSQLHHLDKYLEKQLGIPTKIANPWAKVKVRPSDAPPPKEALRYANALGLAMREI